MRQIVGTDGAAGGHGTMAGARLFAPVTSRPELQAAFVEMVRAPVRGAGPRAVAGEPLLRPLAPRNAKTLSGRPLAK